MRLGEGELKKRIMLSDSYVIDTNPPTGYVEYDEILKWIDEAKKEWEEIAEPEFLIRDNCDVNRDRGNWFKKWFGDSS